MKEIVALCSICKKENCDGKEYKTPDLYGSYGLHIGERVVCKNCDGVICENDIPTTYRLVSGHGDYHDYPLVKSEEVRWK